MSPLTAWADSWYRSTPSAILLRYLLAPLSGGFIFASALRRLAYRCGCLRVERLPVPVIVVGNLTVGGTGKTPLVLWVVERLRAAGRHPGIVSRGHGGAAHAPQHVLPDSDPVHCGDEPVLLARRAGVPVWIGARRAEAGRALLAAHPDTDVIVCDDGLQHYALARDIEIAVLDAARGLGNGWRLPAGPLREAPDRLACVDAVVLNGQPRVALPALPQATFTMHLRAGAFVNLGDPGLRAEAARFRARPVHAVAGIGHPQRFFASLAELGIDAIPHAFPDHHAYAPADLPPGTVLMTEKDAVKCAAFGRDDLWALGVDACVDEGLQRLIIERLKTLHGQQTA